LILDTSFLVDLFLNRKEAISLIAQLEENEILKTTSISVYEIFRGIKNKDKITKIEGFFNDVIVLNLDKNSAKVAGLLSKELCDAGLEIDPEDCMIAAIAKESNDTILTRNVKHFSRVHGLKIKSY
jgi:tRNA(fMet)-specific endonuclease VapC